jgi:hypothetical protein
MVLIKQDLNWYEDPDVMTISIYKGKDLVYKVTADDDGVKDASRKITAPEEVDITNPGPGLPDSGVYKVVIDAGDDTIIKQITTNLHKIVFQGSLFLAGNSSAYPNIVASTSATTVYTDALSLAAMTYHSAGEQILTVGNQYLNLSTLKTSQTITPKDNFTKVIVPKNDVVLNAFQGYFAFDPSQFFIPTPYHIFPISGKEDSNLVDYILANYTPSQKVGQWQTQTLTFDLQSAYSKNGTLSWLIKVPGLISNHKEIIIKDIDITFTKKPWL